MRKQRPLRLALAVLPLVWSCAVMIRADQQVTQRTAAAHAGITFRTSDTCLVCHNGLSTPRGEDISFATSWRASMMANSSRDPYWQAAVRRETLDHPAEAAAIESECAVCHMPMSRAQERARGAKGRVFDHLPVGERDRDDDLLAHDGVSCAMCHQITDERLGTPESFNGGFVVAGPRDGVAAPMFGPFEIDRGRTRIMRSSAGFEPRQGMHVRQAELCATCHTLYTSALGPKGEVVGRLPEQTPYLEWRHSAYPGEAQTCQTCHMPVVREDTAITSVLGEPRTGVARHVFRGGNAFMLRMLNRYRGDLGVRALPQELESSARMTDQFLQESTAQIAVDDVTRANGRLRARVSVRNLAGHKLPSGYPSRRAWIELVVKDASGRIRFHSGAMAENGAIAGNDNDLDPARFEPHHTVIRAASDVQIYESIMLDSAGAVTTGLLRGVRYGKDNRLLPRGFDKRSAPADIAVVGDAAADPTFSDAGDQVLYDLAWPDTDGPATIEATLRFQSISFRWAQNVKPYAAAETQRFVGYYESMAASSSSVLARATR